VQSAGGNIRINAQLIDARTDAHLWAQTYDRELSLENIFDVQAEIARAIASAMRATLTPQDHEQLSAMPTRNMAAYRAYHEAKEIAKQEWWHQNEDYRAALERAIKLDPTFTRAMAELVAWLSFYNFFSVDNPELTLLAEQTLERISVLAPGSVDHVYAQAYYSYYALKDYQLALELASGAEGLRPSDTDVLYLKMIIQRRIDWSKARDSLEKLRLLEPNNGEWESGLIFNLVMSHEYDEAGQALSGAKLPSDHVAWARLLLELRDHGDLDRWAAGLVKIGAESQSHLTRRWVWEGLVTSRDFEASVQIHEDEIQDTIDDPGEIPITLLVSWWLAGHDEELAQKLPALRSLLESESDEIGKIDDPYKILLLATISAIEGDQGGTSKWIRQYFDIARADAAILAHSLEGACRVLAIAELAAETVDCIREGLEKPSFVHAFVEPQLPFYDPIRGKPEFQALMAELE
jgi:tetratricopeptide (TPR) repeat protein